LEGRRYSADPSDHPRIHQKQTSVSRSALLQSKRRIGVVCFSMMKSQKYKFIVIMLELMQQDGFNLSISNYFLSSLLAT
jgi:hypothetical protein